ncbi:MAG: hypothetical protein RR821_13685 [Clostridia bacterium]
MARYHVMVDATGRIGATSADFHLGEGEMLVDFPAGFDFMKQADYKVLGGVLVLEPLPAVAVPPTPIDDLTAITVDHEYRLIMMEMGVAK